MRGDAFEFNGIYNYMQHLTFDLISIAHWEIKKFTEPGVYIFHDNFLLNAKS